MSAKSVTAVRALPVPVLAYYSSGRSFRVFVCSHCQAYFVCHPGCATVPLNRTKNAVAAVARTGRLTGHVTALWHSGAAVPRCPPPLRKLIRSCQILCCQIHFLLSVRFLR